MVARQQKFCMSGSQTQSAAANPINITSCQKPFSIRDGIRAGGKTGVGENLFGTTMRCDGSGVEDEKQINPFVKKNCYSRMKCRFQLLILDHKLFLLSPFSTSLTLSFFIFLCPLSLFIMLPSSLSSLSFSLSLSSLLFLPFLKITLFFPALLHSLSDLFNFFFQLFFSFSVFLGHRNFNGKASSVNKTHPSCYQMSLSLREKNPFNKKSNTFCKNRIQANIWLEPGATQHDFFRWIQLFTNFNAW